VYSLEGKQKAETVFIDNNNGKSDYKQRKKPKDTSCYGNYLRTAIRIPWILLQKPYLNVAKALAPLKAWFFNRSIDKGFSTRTV
jgi:hypothetical protein